MTLANSDWLNPWSTAPFRLYNCRQPQGGQVDRAAADRGGRGSSERLTSVHPECLGGGTAVHFEGTFDVGTPAAKVYDALMEPKELSACMPGFQRVEVKSPREFTVTVKAGVSFIRGDFNIKFDLVEARVLE
jgi:hypothetical protein